VATQSESHARARPSDGNDPHSSALLARHDGEALNVPEGSPATVLVVDDESPIRSLLACLLEPLGYDVLEAGSGSEAIAIAAQSSQPIDVVLLDFQLPEQDGASVLRALRALRPQIPVIVQTGHQGPELLARLGDQCVDGVLEKPFRADCLSELIERVRAHGRHLPG
jgi:CheY-like chemotaxis protein